MAYGLRYTLSTCTPSGVPLRLEILQRDYTGSSYALEGTKSPFVLKVLNDKGKLGRILTTEAKISLWESDDFQLEDIYTGDEREFKVNWYYNNILDWSGYLLPDYFSKDISGNPAIELTAIDCMGTLKDKPYANDDGEPFTGQQSLLTVLINCLKSTDIELPIEVLCDITSTQWIADGARILTFFEDTYIYSGRFSDTDGNVVSKYDVLEALMNQAGCRVVQDEGKWKVQNIAQLEEGAGNLDTFDFNGSRIGARVPFVQNTLNIPSILSGGTQKIIPAHSVTGIYSEHGALFPLIENSTFKDYSTGYYAGWTNINGYRVEPTNTQIRAYNTDGSIRASNTLNIPVPKVLSDASGNNQTAAYMQSSPFDVIAGDILTLKLTVSGFEDDLTVMTIEAGDYILGEDGNWYKDKAQTQLPVARIPLDESPGSGLVYPQEKTFEITSAALPPVPRDTTARVRIYGHDLAGNDNLYQFVITGLEIEKKSEGEDPSGIMYAVERDGEYSKKADIPTVLFSDKVPAGIGSHVYTMIDEDINSTLLNSLGGITRNWNSFNGTEETYQLLIVATQMALSYGRAFKELSVSVDNDNINISNAIAFGCIDGEYIISSKESDLSSGTIKLTLSERFDFTPTLTESVYSVFGSDDGTGLKGIGKMSTGGGGGSIGTLQTVTERGSTTDIPVDLQGGADIDKHLSIPTQNPDETEAGKPYLHFGAIGQGTPEPPVGAQELKELTDVSDALNPSSPTQAGTDPTFLAWNNQTNKWEARKGDYIPMSQKGVANGVATLGTDGILSTPQRPPSELDWDVVEW